MTSDRSAFVDNSDLGVPMFFKQIVAFALVSLLFGPTVMAAESASGSAAKVLASTADHSAFKALQQDFNSGPEVTKVCLGCHTNAAKQIHQTEHWNWEYTNPKTGQKLGKRNVVNDFCTSVASNMNHCAECHVGYNFKDEKTFDFSSEENVDCLVCHDSTGRYQKDPDNYGNPLKSVNLKLIAQSVGPTRRANCGDCHFRGGGGDGVKHGDLDTSLDEPKKAEDVHMDAKGLDFTCTTCHKTEGHQVPGSRYSPTAMDKNGALMRGEAAKRNPATCQSCHGQRPHTTIAKLNDHTDKIACQTCHIPAFARGDQPTEMSWDWSTLGQRDAKGKPIVKMNDDGFPVYDGSKGSFTWAENVKPDYIWFNGTITYTLPTDKLDKSKEPIGINHFEGSPTDGKSMIWPVKVFHGKQVFDPVYKNLVVTHESGDDDTALWKNTDWQKAVTAGMASVNRPFSGKIDFITTTMTFPITHMVAPKEKALACQECHASNGRLENVPGLYIPGRTNDHLRWMEIIGWAAAGLSLAVVLGHALIRTLTSGRRK